MEAITNHDADAFAKLYDDNAVAFDPQYPKPLKGKAEVKKDIEDFFVAFPDIRAKVMSIIPNGNLIASEVLMTGTHKGPLVSLSGPIPPTNKPVEFRIGRFIQVNEQGLIVECNRYYDLAGIMMQLGLM